MHELDSWWVVWVEDEPEAAIIAALNADTAVATWDEMNDVEFSDTSARVLVRPFDVDLAVVFVPRQRIVREGVTHV